MGWKGDCTLPKQIKTLMRESVLLAGGNSPTCTDEPQALFHESLHLVSTSKPRPVQYKTLIMGIN